MLNGVPPVVTAIDRLDADPTKAVSVQYDVVFSEAVTGVDADDFALSLSGSASGTVDTTIGGGGSDYTVTVTGISGNGTIRLDLLDNGTIASVSDSTPLDGNFTSGQSYTIDNAAPDSAITFPVDATAYNATGWTDAITGTAADVGGSGVASVEVSIQQGSGNYWGGSAFDSAAEVYLPATGTDTWTLAFADANFPADGAYTVHSLATDEVGNVQTTSTTATFTYDTTAPTSTITFPGDGAAYNATGWTDAITGTAADVGGSGVASVEVSIQQGSGNYWGGSAFDSATEVYLPATGTDTWTLAFADANFPADGAYTVHSLATDEVGNVQTTSTTATFTYDTTAPTSAITFPVNAAAYNATGWTDAITGTAADVGGSGVASVEVSIQQGSGNYWSGTAFNSATEVYLPATGTDTWTLAFADANFPADGAYTVHARATDEVGNVGSAATATFTYDTTAPTSAITFPVNAAAYNTAGWTGAISGTADAGSGASIVSVGVSIQQGTGNYWDGAGFNSATEVFVTATGTASWTLAFAAANFPADGAYTVHARATDNAGNTGSDSTAGFIYDTAAPTSTITFPVNGAYYTAAGWIDTIIGTAADVDGSGVESVAVSIRQGSGNYWSGAAFDSATEVFLPATGKASWSQAFAKANFPADGAYTVHARATDKAGNVGTVSTAAFTYDANAPTSTITFPVDNAYYKQSAWTDAITGTADDGTGSGVAQVDVSIRQGTGNYWNGTAFNSATEVFFTATGTDTWTWAFAAADFPADGAYTVHARATDVAGNVETGPTATFTYDTTAPTVLSINRHNANPTKATSLQFDVVFSEAVTGVNLGDFALALTGSAAGTISSVVGVSASSYTVTVSGVSGSLGTLGVNLENDGSIADLAGNVLVGDFTGQVYDLGISISKVAVAERVSRDGTLSSLEYGVITWAAATVNPVKQVSLMMDGQTVTTIFGPYGPYGTDYYYSHPFDPLKAGTHSYTIIVTDSTDLIDTYSGTFQVYPAISMVVVAESSNPDGTLRSLENGVITWAVTSSNLISVKTVKIDGQSVGGSFGPYGPYQNYSYFYATPFTPLKAGTHNFSIVATDNQGFSASYDGSFVVYPAISKVVIAEQTYQNGTLQAGENGLISWAASSSNGVKSQNVTLDGHAITTIYGPYGPYSGDYYSSARLGALAAGNHTVTIKVTDTKGYFATYQNTFNVAAALMVDATAAPGGPVESLTYAELAPIIVEAQQRLEDALGPQVASTLDSLSFQVADLPNGMLGEAAGKTIRIDDDAAGYGWFVDPTPADNLEFVDSLGAVVDRPRGKPGPESVGPPDRRNARDGPRARLWTRRSAGRLDERHPAARRPPLAGRGLRPGQLV